MEGSLEGVFRLSEVAREIDGCRPQAEYRCQGATFRTLILSPIRTKLMYLYFFLRDCNIKGSTIISSSLLLDISTSKSTSDSFISKAFNSNKRTTNPQIYTPRTKLKLTGNHLWYLGVSGVYWMKVVRAAPLSFEQKIFCLCYITDLVGPSSPAKRYVDTCRRKSGAMNLCCE